jgi:hypothetical protein
MHQLMQVLPKAANRVHINRGESARVKISIRNKMPGNMFRIGQQEDAAIVAVGLLA